MPYPRDVEKNFEREYGAKEGKRRFFAWKNANPEKFKKALKTARKKGHGGVIRSLAKKRK